MTHPGPDDDDPPQSAALGPPTITATAGHIIIGAGFLPDHDVTIRVSYTADAVSDYLTYTAGPHGDLYAEVAAGSAGGPLHITATDHRTDPAGECGLLWSNCLTVCAGDSG